MVDHKFDVVDYLIRENQRRMISEDLDVLVADETDNQLDEPSDPRPEEISSAFKPLSAQPPLQPSLPQTLDNPRSLSPALPTSSTHNIRRSKKQQRFKERRLKRRAQAQEAAQSSLKAVAIRRRSRAKTDKVELNVAMGDLRAASTGWVGVGANDRTAVEAKNEGVKELLEGGRMRYVDWDGLYVPLDFSFHST